jgi:hypothetical protein
MKATLVGATVSPATPFKVPPEALKLVEKMRNKGIQVQRIPPADVNRTLDYPSLSDFLDAQIMDIHRVCPEIFSTSTQQNIAPGRLKAYLYAQVMHHLSRAGVLVNVGGVKVPDCGGTSCPTPLLAYLQFIGIYAEGDAVGRPKYIMPATTPVVGTTGIVSGAVAETAIANSSFAFNMLGYQLNAAQGEMILQVSAADSNNFIVNWQNQADTVSDILEASNYPTAPMWATPPPVPDGSFFSFYTRNAMGVGSGCAYFTSPFEKWDVDIASLYTQNVPTIPYGALFAPRPGPHDAEWPFTWTGSSYQDPFYIRKEMFIFIIRNNTYVPGAPVSELRQYHGDKLSTFRIAPIILQMTMWHENVAKCWMQLRANGCAYDLNGLFAFVMVCEHAMLRRLQLNTIGQPTTAIGDYVRFLQPSDADEFVIPAPLAQIVNDLGPVVRDGMLHLPMQQIATGTDKWTDWWNTLGPGPTIATEQIFQQCLKRTGGTTDPTLTWEGSVAGTQTMGSGWIAAYILLTNFLGVSWSMIHSAHSYMVNFISNGNAYGKGDILYPISKGPRGGLVMLTRLDNASPIARVIDATNQALTFTSTPVASIASYVPITGAEIAMVAIEGWGQGNQTFTSTCKYVKQFSGIGENNYIDRYMSVTLGPGGTFLDALSAAMERRHGVDMDPESGLVSAGDNTDACLWDAIKRTVGTIAGALQPAASKAAGIGCGMIPLVGQFAKPICEAAATNLTSMAADAAKSSTNRHSTTSARAELKKFDTTVRKAKPIEYGELPEERRPQRDTFDDDDIYQPRARRTGRRNGDDFDYQPRRRKQQPQQKKKKKPQGGQQPKKKKKKQQKRRN